MDGSSRKVCCVASQVRSSRPREVRHHWEAREQRQYRHHWKAGYCRQNPFWLMLCQAQGRGHRDWYWHRWSPLFERIAMPCEIRRFNGLRQALPAVLQVGQHRKGATVRRLRSIPQWGNRGSTPSDWVSARRLALVKKLDRHTSLPGSAIASFKLERDANDFENSCIACHSSG